MKFKLNTKDTPEGSRSKKVFICSKSSGRKYSSSVVASLVEKGLLEERGRLELPGRPIAYGTTANFLRCFGLSSLDELPPIPEREGTAGEPVTLDAVIDAGDGETAPAAEEPEDGAVSADD